MLFKLCPTTRPEASQSPGTAAGAPDRDLGRVQVRTPADARPAPRAVHPSPDRGGVRLPQPSSSRGWEADDVIATLATRADEAGIKTCVVSTDRDAFQLVSESVLPDDDSARRRRRHVYTPERVELRYGIRPDKIPDFIGLKGDTSDNIPGVPGIETRRRTSSLPANDSVEAMLATTRVKLACSCGRSQCLERRGTRSSAVMRRDLEPTSTSRTSSLDRPTVRS